MSGFRVIDFEPVNRKSLLATCTLELPSGLRLACVVLAGRDGGEPWVTPARSSREHDGRTVSTDVVTWATPERRKAWQELALAAVRPHLTAPAREEESDGSYCPF